MSKELSEFIHKELERRGLSARELSRLAGLSTTTVHYIINNPGSQPTTETCISLAKVLELPENTLLGLAGYGQIDFSDNLNAEVFALATYLDNLPSKTREYALEGCWAIARLVAEAVEGREAIEG